MICGSPAVIPAICGMQVYVCLFRLRYLETFSSFHSRFVGIVIFRSNFLFPNSCKFLSLYLSSFLRHYCSNQSVWPPRCIVSIINMAGRTVEMELQCIWSSFLIRGVRWDWSHWVLGSVVGLLYQSRMIDEHGAVGGIGIENRSYLEKTCSIAAVSFTVLHVLRTSMFMWHLKIHFKRV
jgi:hypothetical protein